MAPDILKLGKPVMIGGTDPKLTHIGNPWLFRCRPNDIYSARVIADYGVNTLEQRKWAIVHSTDAFGTSGMKNLVEALKKFGVTPVLIQGYTNNEQDFTPVVLAIKQSGADVIGTYMTFETDQGIFARQLRQLGVTFAWVGSPPTATTTALKLAGPALYGSYAVADFIATRARRPRLSPRQIQAAYKAAPDIFSSWTYDAIHVLALAINKAELDHPGKIRTAILGVKKATRARKANKLRSERRRPARLQHREEREGHHRIQQAHRLRRLTFRRSLRRRHRASASSRAPLKRRPSMEHPLQLLFTGLGIGGIYALVALGFVLIFARPT